ncbi:MAG: hypothetical protein ACFE8P_09000, partial [Promethearchaeota archaeon]
MEKNEENTINNEKFWKEEIKKHWKALVLGAVAFVGLLIVAVVVFIWHVETTPFGNQGTATFNEWSLEWIVGFVIVLVLWELLFVGLPAVLIFGVGGYLWWKTLTSDEQAKFKCEDKKKEKKYKHAGGCGCGCGLFMFIAFCIFMAIHGAYSVPFGSQPYSY